MMYMDGKEMNGLYKKYKLVPQVIAEEREVHDNIVKNLKYLMFKYRTKDQVSMPQKDMADLLGIGAPQLTKILQGNQTPTVFPCLDHVKRVFGYSIDEFLYTDIEMTESLIEGADDNLPVASYMKYLGLYQVYYYDTSSFKEKELCENDAGIKSGIMYVERDTKTDKHRVYAIFNMTKERADDYYRNILKLGKGNLAACRDKIISMSRSQHVYFGDLDLSERHVYINLRFENAKDRVQMIFHRPDSNSNQFIGGLGAMVSVSKGRNASPCVGCIAIANGSLDVSAEEIASHLLMHHPDLETHKDLDEVIDFTIDLYSPDFSRLSNNHKKDLVEKDIDRIINETIEQNLFRTVIVSPEDDDKFYHYLKRVLSNH